MTDVFVLIIYVIIVFYAITRPYVAFAGYIWVDTFRPNNITYGFLAGKPLSMIMVLVCLTSFVINFNKLRKPVGVMTPLLIILFSLWITYTTFDSYFPFYAWFKWNFAMTTLVMTLLLLFVITSKEQLEFCLIALAISISYFVLAAGLKSLAGGGGYGRVLVSSGGNSGIGESSTLAMVSVMLLPILLFLQKHTLLLSQYKQYKFFWRGAMLVTLASVIGTQARTGLVALVVFVGIYVMKSKNKFRNIFLVSLISIITLAFFVSEDWKQRMDTMNNVENEGSAMGRIYVWRWTWEFVKENPAGGGFNAYLANSTDYALGFSDIPGVGKKAKAFHSIYFETLGEHGYFGLFLFLSLIFCAWQINRSLLKDKNETNTDPWVQDLAMTFNHCLLIYCVAGAFIGVAFLPILYYFIAFSVSLKKIKYLNHE